ncbi:MAG TPA: O-antigen ligase family protein [Devosia sp.]|nr:O-antigen ligase family protein [Devosia sp.]
MAIDWGRPESRHNPNRSIPLTATVPTGGETIVRPDAAARPPAALSAPRPSVEIWLRRALLCTTLVGAGLFGFFTTYILLLLGLAALAWLVLPGRGRIVLDAAGRGLLLGWLGLAIVIVLDALFAGHPGDMLYAFNFGMLLLYPAIAGIEGRAARPGNAGRLADLALLGTLLAAAIAVAEKLLLSADRTGIIENDPIRFGDTAVIIGFLALAGIDQYRGPRRWLYLGVPVLAVLVAVLAGARSALVAIPLLVLLAIVLLVRPWRRALAALAAAAAALGVALGAALLSGNARVASLFHILPALFGSGALDDEAVRERLVLYRAGIEAFWRSPLLGFGWNRRMEAVGNMLPAGDKALAGLPHLHDEVLNFAVGTGALGVLIYLLLLAAPVVAVWRSPRDSQFRVRVYGIAVLLVSYVVLGVADVMLGFETHTALYVAFAAAILGYCRDAPPETRAKAVR